MRLRVLLPTALVMLLFPAAASASYPHVVQPGETLTSVAATDGLSLAAIAAANGISTQAQLVAGRVLWIPPRTRVSAGAGAAATGTTVSAVVQTQSDPDSDSDTDSTATDVTTTSTSSNTAQAQTTTSTSSNTAQAQTAAQVVGGPVPTMERVSASEIASIADANGVPAALAEAIAWQESGWNNDEVSGVGAVGVMQIVPATWTWIDRYLTPSDPLGRSSATENVRAGVLLLHQLLQVSGGSESMAIAGYFQGIASVKARGMYAATRQYVSDVLALAQRL